jgi:capsular exopolysaccharide synthesis family protein
MSRIFDALQRSGVEQAGVEYPDVVSVITEFLEVPAREVRPAPPQPTESAPPELPRLELPRLELPRIELPRPELPRPELRIEELRPDLLDTQKPTSHELAEFPSLSVSLTTGSRLVFFTEPDSLAAEKFRFLGVRLRQVQQSRSLKKVLVTSTIPEEGKSFVSANLAGVLARRKQKVLLIEGDLRRPTLSKLFGVEKLVGLGEWLQGDRQRLNIIYRLEGPGLWLMPAGVPPTNPLELMQSGSLSQLMTQLTAMFDWIIVDSPPLLPLADTTVWSRMTDGTLLVAREGTTQKAMLERGLESIKKSELLGVVLNGCKDSHGKNYYQSYLTPGTSKPLQQLP